ncbi:MAG: hypothetical protein ACHQFW_03520 [Chitinophagales bacterium]
MHYITFSAILTFFSVLFSHNSENECACEYQIHFDDFGYVQAPCYLPDTVQINNEHGKTELIIYECGGKANFKTRYKTTNNLKATGNFISAAITSDDTLYVLDEETYEERLYIHKCYHAEKNGEWHYYSDE